MPYYSFATYADYREEWAIQADSIDEARARIGIDPDGDWLQDAIPLEVHAVEHRDEFVTGDDDETPDIAEIELGGWADKALAERTLQLAATDLLETLRFIAGHARLAMSNYGFDDVESIANRNTSLANIARRAERVIAKAEGRQP